MSPAASDSRQIVCAYLTHQSDKTLSRHRTDVCVGQISVSHKTVFCIREMSVCLTHHSNRRLSRDQISDSQMSASDKTFLCIRQMSVSVPHISQTNVWVGIRYQTDKLLRQTNVYFRENLFSASDKSRVSAVCMTSAHNTSAADVHTRLRICCCFCFPYPFYMENSDVVIKNHNSRTCGPISCKFHMNHLSNYITVLLNWWQSVCSFLSYKVTSHLRQYFIYIGIDSTRWILKLLTMLHLPNVTQR